MTKKLMVGKVAVGGGAPVSIQSMCNTKTDDVAATVAQIHALEDAGCEIIRVAVPDEDAAKAVDKIKEQIAIPLIADIHFNYKLALMCAERGIDSPLALMFAHHMNDGSMFSAFASYSDIGFAEAHSEILLQTPEGKMRLSVIAADVVDSNIEYKRLDFAGTEDFESWLGRLLTEADVVLDGDTRAESVKAFCTCSYGRRNGHERTIVYACERAE